MKPLPIFLIILNVFLIQINGIAQNFAKEGDQWNIAIYPTFSPNTTSYSIRVQGDTIINNQAYKKLQSSPNADNSSWPPLNRFIREDSLQKVYLCDGTSELVLYDFSLQVGDTFKIESPFFNDFQCEIVVLEIDSITLNNGGQRKRLTIGRTDIPDWGPPDYWVEGIGSMKGVLSHFMFHCATDYSEELLCFYQNEELQFPEMPFSCFITSAYDLEKELQVRIYPNPVGDQLFLFMQAGQNEIKNVFIYSISGIRMGQFHVKSNEAKINISKFSNGIYLVLAELDSGKFFAERIVKK
ncbi:MAG: T9SS type A sorting domain-containing protein [Bacteroidetes bacterium]|nr:T9SS type A sorting domain-containing protein [Bacteroidota bacterium]